MTEAHALYRRAGKAEAVQAGRSGDTMTEKPLHVRVAEALGWEWFHFVDKSFLLPPFAHKQHEYGSWERGLCENPQWDITQWFTSKNHLAIPRYDTNWSATGLLIEKYKFCLRSPTEPPWIGSNLWEASHHEYPAGWREADGYGQVKETVKGGPTPLIAVCNLILALKEAGKL